MSTSSSIASDGDGRVRPVGLLKRTGFELYLDHGARQRWHNARRACCGAGYALIDEENGEHLPITFAVKLSQGGVVLRQEVLVYREARGDEVRDARFREQFVGKTARDPISTTVDISAISGATISSHAMAVGVKRAAVLFEELMAGPVVTAQAPKSLAGAR